MFPFSKDENNIHPILLEEYLFFHIKQVIHPINQLFQHKNSQNYENMIR